MEARKRFAYFEREGWGAGCDVGTYMGEPMVSRFGGYNTIRSHLSMLPRRRIGVVAQTNGPAAGGATDIIAALAYDLEAGRANVRALASARVDSLIAQIPAARASIVAGDSVRRSRQQPLRRPLADFTGSYHNEAFGTFMIAVQGGALHYRWGVLDGPVEVFDAANNVLRIEIAGTGSTVSFQFGASGPARSLELMGETFVKRTSQGRGWCRWG